MLKEYDKIKEEIMTKRLNQFILRFLSIYKTMLYCFKCRKITEKIQKLSRQQMEE